MISSVHVFCVSYDCRVYLSCTGVVGGGDGVPVGGGGGVKGLGLLAFCVPCEAVLVVGHAWLATACWEEGMCAQDARPEGGGGGG